MSLLRRFPEAKDMFLEAEMKDAILLLGKDGQLYAMAIGFEQGESTKEFERCWIEQRWLFPSCRFQFCIVLSSVTS